MQDLCPDFEQIFLGIFHTQHRGAFDHLLRDRSASLGNDELGKENLSRLERNEIGVIETDLHEMQTRTNIAHSLGTETGQRV